MENITLHFNEFSNSSNSSFPLTGPSVIKRIVDIALPVCLVIAMIALGSSLNIKLLAKELKNPIDLIVGIVCQCFALPLVTFGLAHALQMSSYFSLGMILIGCCPGGVASNIFSYWSHGDVPLSIGLTSISNILAVGTMPLNLFFYARSWTDAELKIPYLSIVISFLMVFIPVLFGMLLNWKWPKSSDLIMKIGSICGMTVIMILAVLISVGNQRIFLSTWKPILAAILMPFVAFGLGYIASSIVCLSHTKRRTIAIETGIQNFPLCVTILNISFTTELFISLSVYPLLYSITSALDGLVIVVCFRALYAYNQRRKKKPTDEQELEDLNQPELENPQIVS